MKPPIANPHRVLRVERDATTEDIRRAYLSLVREFPPDRDADKFHEIHSAYQMLCDPQAQAEAILTSYKEPPELSKVISEAELERPRLPKLVLLALGNQE